jgi:hypothetical protein
MFQVTRYHYSLWRSRDWLRKHGERNVYFLIRLSIVYIGHSSREKGKGNFIFAICLFSHTLCPVWKKSLNEIEYKSSFGKYRMVTLHTKKKMEYG